MKMYWKPIMAYETLQTIFTVSHSLGLRSTDDVTIVCWWRHNNQIIATWAREK